MGSSSPVRELGAPSRPRARVRLAAGSDRILKRAIVGLRAVHGGVWLGLLDERDLQDATDTAYRRWSQYRESEYNLSGLRSWELEAIRCWFPSEGQILVLACGGGREVLALADLGYEVHGADCVAELVTAASRLADEHAPGRATVSWVGPGAVPSTTAAYDGAIVGWGAYMHIRGSRARVDLLRRLADRIRPGAPVLLSFFSRDDESRRHRLVRRVADRIRRLRGRQPVELGDDYAGTYDHHFQRDELVAELTSAGLTLLHFGTEPYGHAVARRSSAAMGQE